MNIAYILVVFRKCWYSSCNNSPVADESPVDILPPRNFSMDSVRGVPREEF